MAKPSALPFAFRLSSRPAKMARPFNVPRPLSVLAACNIVSGSNGKATQRIQNLGFRNYRKSSFSKYSLLGLRDFSSSVSKNAGERSEKPLPWLSASMERERRKASKNETGKGVRSSWEESAEKFLKGAGPDVEVKVRETHNCENNRRKEFRYKDDNPRAEDEDEDGDTEVSNDPRWHNIQRRYEGFVNSKSRPEVKRWNKQEEWGRKTWKEAKESSLPKIVGEGIYGVGPVLAALSAGRRELYALYVQEGLNLSSNNRKKDKRGFERVLRLAENIGLAKKEVSKHDLNMIVDNRPHQGLMLDASPLEMVDIKELDHVSPGLSDRVPLWVALDEVTDPQNLGAIIRSAYFFGACGVVLCAKNSAPLSGVVSKASAGALELTELRSCRNMMRFLGSSAENGWRVLGGSVSPRAVPIGDVGPDKPTILVLGSEGTGLRPLVERSCSELIRIPGNQPVGLVDEGADSGCREFLAVESLNVSVAAGVMLHHLIGGSCGGVREISPA
ncbi:tRNA/rRNA methyltransferase (SpoU) family protein [Striga hermonthica]|uniref:rRNA methyltransferase 1, mitochondrial n=1 Tax=Striga hermonthica TaxID=68872 RepID=A0A9N7RPE4_STRHE|nr:tRNA/rRNA methyltransferase (SpoU) family protein [Striga hermonthica]